MRKPVGVGFRRVGGYRLITMGDTRLGTVSFTVLFHFLNPPLDPQKNGFLVFGQVYEKTYNGCME